MQPWPSSTRRHDDYGATSELLAGSPPSLSPASKSGALDSSSRGCSSAATLPRLFQTKTLAPPPPLPPPPPAPADTGP